MNDELIEKETEELARSLGFNYRQRIFTAFLNDEGKKRVAIPDKTFKFI